MSLVPIATGVSIGASRNLIPSDSTYSLNDAYMLLLSCSTVRKSGGYSTQGTTCVEMTALYRRTVVSSVMSQR